MKFVQINLTDEFKQQNYILQHLSVQNKKQKQKKTYLYYINQQDDLILSQTLKVTFSK